MTLGGGLQEVSHPSLGLFALIYTHKHTQNAGREGEKQLFKCDVCEVNKHKTLNNHKNKNNSCRKKQFRKCCCCDATQYPSEAVCGCLDNSEFRHFSFRNQVMKLRNRSLDALAQLMVVFLYRVVTLEISIMSGWTLQWPHELKLNNSV